MDNHTIPIAVKVIGTDWGYIADIIKGIEWGECNLLAYTSYTLLQRMTADQRLTNASVEEKLSNTPRMLVQSPAR